MAQMALEFLAEKRRGLSAAGVAGAVGAEQDNGGVRGRAGAEGGEGLDVGDVLFLLLFFSRGLLLLLLFTLIIAVSTNQRGRSRRRAIHKILNQIRRQLRRDMIDDSKPGQEQHSRRLFSRIMIMIFIRDGHIGGGQFQFLDIAIPHRLASRSQDKINCNSGSEIIPHY